VHNTGSAAITEDSLLHFFSVIHGFKGTRVSVVPATKNCQVIFASAAQQKRALLILNRFKLAGHELYLHKSANVDDVVPPYIQRAWGISDNRISNCNVCVKGLPLQTTDDELRKIYSVYGPIKSVKVSRDHQTDIGRGYGFVWFERPADANRAMADSMDEKGSYVLDWYRVLSWREAQWLAKGNPNLPKIQSSAAPRIPTNVLLLSWHPHAHLGIHSGEKLLQGDFDRFFSRFGPISEVFLREDRCHCKVVFASAGDAEFALQVPKIEIRGRQIVARRGQATIRIFERHSSLVNAQQ
jgi:hypothetical protein